MCSCFFFLYRHNAYQRRRATPSDVTAPTPTASVLPWRGVRSGEGVGQAETASEVDAPGLQTARAQREREHPGRQRTDRRAHQAGGPKVQGPGPKQQPGHTV